MHYMYSAMFKSCLQSIHFFISMHNYMCGLSDSDDNAVRTIVLARL